MKNTFVSRDKDDVTFTMEFEPQEFEDAKIKVYQRNKNQFEIDGFRKGKAPRSIIERKYGENIFAEDAINDLLNREYPAALVELNLDAIDQPRVEFSQLEKGKGFTATVTVAVAPELDLKDYKGVEIEEITGDVTEKEVDNEMEMLRRRNARLESVDRPVQKDDVVIFDFTGYVDGEEFEGGKAENYSLKIGSGSFVPGFEDQLIGAEADKDVEVKVTFPEDYQAEDLAGKEAVFKCKIHEVKEELLPELDDEFAKDVSEYDTLEELRESARNDLALAKAENAESRMKEEVVRKIAENNEINVPDVMVEDELNTMMQDMDQQLRQQGMSLPQYLQYAGKEPKDFREELRDNAVRRVENRLIVKAVAKQENIEATQEDIDKQIKNMAAQFGLEEDKVREIVQQENAKFLEQDIKMQKAIDFLLENAVKVPAKETDSADDAAGKEEEKKDDAE